MWNEKKILQSLGLNNDDSNNVNKCYLHPFPQ